MDGQCPEILKVLGYYGYNILRLYNVNLQIHVTNVLMSYDP